MLGTSPVDRWQNKIDAKSNSITKQCKSMHFNKTAIYTHHCEEQSDEAISRLRAQTQKVLLYMRLTAIILLSACMAASAKGLTQGISLSEKNVSLDKIFEKIQKQSDYTFVYTESLLKKAKPVSINISNGSIEQILDACLAGQPLSYTILNRMVIIKEKETKSPNENAVISNESEKSPPIDVTGKVTDADGNPLAGATVKVKGTTKGTTTNNDGVFVLKGVNDNATLEISFVGYETYTIAVANKTSIAASLKVKPENLNEVIINKGYYTEQQRLSTGNVTKVTSKIIEKSPVQNVLLSLQGRVPGLLITQANGIPGGRVNVAIRGQNSIQNGNDPLYVIDGVPYPAQGMITTIGGILGTANGTSGNPLSYINPLDIENVDILKDADATAIYGSRGANGVILITTKRGKAGKMKVDLNMETGWGKVASKLDVLKTPEYLQMRKEALLNDGRTVSSSDYDINGAWDTTRYTDWQKELIGKTANYNNLQATVSGGNLNTQYFIGGTYHKETTVFPGSLYDQKASVHFSMNNISINQRFRIMLSGNYLIDNNHLMSQDLTSKAILLPPDAPSVYNSDGSLNWAPSSSGRTTWDNPSGGNPMSWLNLKYVNRTYSLQSNATISYELFKNLELKTNLGYNNLITDEFKGTPITFIDPFFWSIGNNLRSASYANSNIRTWILEPQIQYTQKIGSGKLSGLIGATIQQNKSDGQVLNGQGYNSDLVLEDIKSAASITVGSTVHSIYKYNALFTRLNYNWKDKYLVNLTGRRDGTSRFGPSSQFQNFGAVGVGWIFTNEKFFANRILSFGKLRGSYGTSGSDQVGDYSFLDLYFPNGVAVPYQGATGIFPGNLYTPDLAWEETKKFELALVLGFLNNRINVDVSGYVNRSSNQLVGYSLPYLTGFTSIRRNLDAVVQNKGLEFIINSENIVSRQVRWTSTLNFSLNRNKLVSISPGMSSDYQKKVGNDLNSFLVYHFLGVDPSTGVNMFSNGKGSATSRPDTANASTQNILISTTPKYYGGFQNSIEYKNFQLDFLIQFVKALGRNYQFGNFPGNYGINQPVTILNRWTKIGDQSDIQRFSTNSSVVQPFRNGNNSDAAFSDASFIRLKNISLSWSLPKQILNKINFQNLRIFVQCQNLFTVTKYEGLDPETQNVSSLPPLRVSTVGIRASF